ncbi:hypothetical protein HK098_001823 [Nowakowskiella sp. JEL0407]|nr:hypothetical protein HK098_001823 [Nowakowskiella sp. JEL0407]
MKKISKSFLSFFSFLLFDISSRCFSIIPNVVAGLDYEKLLEKSKEVSMSGLVGLVDTDALFAEPGTEQRWYWRVAQSFIGLGAIRILARIAKSPCFEVIHQMFGIKPPEAVEAREFWLRQESWTEMERLETSQEDTSYHKINQGAGPQAILIRTQMEAYAERERWATRNVKKADGGSAPMTPFTPITTVVARPTINTASSIVRVSEAEKKKHTDVTEGTTDKWWMDRWQIEALATSAFNDVTIGISCQTLTATYFGKTIDQVYYVALLVLLIATTIACVVVGLSTDYVFILHIFATTVLGFVVNTVSALRAWRFFPSKSLVDEKPKFAKNIPTDFTDEYLIRVAVQNSLFQLIGCFILPAAKIDESIEDAKTKKPRYHVDTSKEVPHTVYTAPDDDKQIDRRNEMDWISYQVQSTYYGLIVSVEPDNVANRSLGILICVVCGFVLLLVGIGSTSPEGWDVYVLCAYIFLALVAIMSRNRSASWTMPIFAIIDHTTKKAPEQIKVRWPTEYYTEVGGAPSSRWQLVNWIKHLQGRARVNTTPIP